MIWFFFVILDVKLRLFFFAFNLDKGLKKVKLISRGQNYVEGYGIFHKYARFEFVQ